MCELSLENDVTQTVLVYEEEEKIRSRKSNLKTDIEYVKSCCYFNVKSINTT